MSYLNFKILDQNISGDRNPNSGAIKRAVFVNELGGGPKTPNPFNMWTSASIKEAITGQGRQNLYVRDINLTEYTKQK